MKKEVIIFSKRMTKIWVQETEDGDVVEIIGESLVLDSFKKDRLEFIVQDTERSDTTLRLEKIGNEYMATFSENLEIWREKHSETLNLRLMSDFLDTDEEGQDVLGEFIKENLGKRCEYQGKEWIICGMTDQLPILGSESENGSIKEFSDNIIYRKGFKSYELAKPKLIKLCMKN